MNLKIVIVLILFLAMIGVATAADYLGDINSSTNVYTNRSYQMNTNSALPVVLFILVSCCGFYTLVFSVIASESQGMDLFGYVAVPLLGFAAYSSRAIDVITGSGVVVTQSGVVSLENHTIYSNPAITIIFIILFIISLLNVYRVIVISRGVDEDAYTDSDK